MLQYNGSATEGSIEYKVQYGRLCFCNNTKIALTELIGGIRKRFGKLQGEPETKETIKKSGKRKKSLILLHHGTNIYKYIFF